MWIQHLKCVMLGGFRLVIVKCKECGKEYQLKPGENPEDYQCECGGRLRDIETAMRKKALSQMVLLALIIYFLYLVYKVFRSF
jgi:hypothetical protein